MPFFLAAFLGGQIAAPPALFQALRDILLMRLRRRIRLRITFPHAARRNHGPLCLE